MAKGSENEGFVHGHPHLHPIAEIFERNPGEVHEVIGHQWIGPAAYLLKTVWQIPMVQRHQWLYVVLQQLVDQIVVVVDADLADLICESCRQYSGPAQRESVIVYAQFCQHFDVSFVLVVGIASVVT